MSHAGFFRLLMKGIFDPYIVWPFEKKLISWLVMCFSTCDFTVFVPQFLRTNSSGRSSGRSSGYYLGRSYFKHWNLFWMNETIVQLQVKSLIFSRHNVNYVYLFLRTFLMTFLRTGTKAETINLNRELDCLNGPWSISNTTTFFTKVWGCVIISRTSWKEARLKGRGT